MDASKEFYSPDEVAELLDVHVRTVRRFIRDGKLKASRVGKQYRVASSDLSEFLGTDGLSAPKPAASRKRRALVSSTMDVDAISHEESDRIATLLTGVFNSARDRSDGKQLECIYYEELGRLRVIINADVSFTSSLLNLVDGVLKER